MEERINLTEFAEAVTRLKETIAETVVGQRHAIDLLLTAILSDGHVLLEGVPGVAKTLTAKLMARLIDARFNRLQFTPDLMPSDVLGTSVYNMQRGEFTFHRGPIFTDILLVDEINRAPAKTQSALFEVMEERQATIDGTTYTMGPLYTVIATQNPVEQEGTYKLPEAQLDRFLMKITIGYPTPEEEVEILERHQQPGFNSRVKELRPLLSIDQLLSFRALSQQVYMDRSLLKYIADIVTATRESRALLLGASPRASVAIMRSSKAYAMLDGRDFVTPDDIKAVTPYVLQHRIQLTAETEMEGLNAVNVIDRIIEKIEIPK